MKKIPVVLLVAFLLSGTVASSQIKLPKIGDVVKSAQDGVSDDDVGQALKEALHQGIENGVKELIKKDGYFGNKLLRIPLPPQAEKAKPAIKKYVPKGDEKIREAVVSMNRAAEDAANEALPIFSNAITSMTFDDAKNILFGADDAATNYLKQKTLKALVTAYSPRINASMEKVGATRAWEVLANANNAYAKSAIGRIQKAKRIDPNLGQYVTRKALDGLFIKVQQEEEKVRKNFDSRTTQLMQDVFGLLD